MADPISADNTAEISQAYAAHTRAGRLGKADPKARFDYQPKGVPGASGLASAVPPAFQAPVQAATRVASAVRSAASAAPRSAQSDDEDDPYDEDGAAAGGAAAEPDEDEATALKRRTLLAAKIMDYYVSGFTGCQ